MGHTLIICRWKDEGGSGSQCPSRSGLTIRPEIGCRIRAQNDTGLNLTIGTWVASSCEIEDLIPLNATPLREVGKHRWI